MRFFPVLLWILTALNAQDTESLTRQLRGETCALDQSCTQRGWFNWLVTSKRECVRDAAQCLATMGAAAKPAVPALIEAVRNGPNNFDTGDGVIHVRDAVVEALGRTGDPRALPVLLEALANPKPMDVDLGAIPRDKPVGELAALNALGFLGPAAAAAVPRILPYLGHEERYFVEGAATALGSIGEVSAIPALTAALGRGETAYRVAEALGRFGPAAHSALPALTRLIEEAPERDGEVRIRLAIAAIGGRAAADVLPKSYHMKMNAIWKLARDTAKGRGVRLRGAHLNSPAEEIATTLASGASLVIGFSREAWVARRAVEGTVTVTPPGAEPIRETYLGADRLARVLARAVTR